MVVYLRRFFFSSRRRHTRCSRDWSSDVCSSDSKTIRCIRGDRAAASTALKDMERRYRRGQSEVRSGERRSQRIEKALSIWRAPARDQVVSRHVAKEVRTSVIEIVSAGDVVEVRTVIRSLRSEEHT